ncbi:flagellar basal-body MS-ring/collar protein FliF [Nevskia ramosa]|uniref:flagellar basal-body MS-ring/collar protein FliF n=1 Tax=Nevskia ramosa TaxID=64002 RepID=UPI002352A326|nr:flagellar basal-body MS-ring/collar protein FliF [Nevskia ramosa]
MADIALPAGFASRKLQDLPAVRQLMAIAGIALAIAAGITLFFWAQKPNQAPLYPNLGEKDSAEVADALRAAGIEFKLDGASGSVTVPADKVHEARLRLASQGLPKGSSLGMEMIREEQGFGTSQFIETARYQLALETELSRTIGSLMSVKSSRVHLALPKPSAFARSRDQASASVLLELHPGRQLEAGQVASIVHMVASSVPNLQPSAVTVIDQYGHLLTGDGNNSEADASSEQFSFARRVEADYVRRIEQLLAPMMGAGRVSAQVSADVDFSVTEEAREAYNPNPQAIRSEQTSEEATRNGAGGAAQGIPGATSNQPPNPTQAVPLNTVNGAPVPSAPATAVASTAASTTPTTETRSATRNFEIDKTISHTRKSPGKVQRLSVAVLVDNLPKANDKGVLMPTALTDAEIAKVQALVREAVGFDEKRGDTVTVQNAAFMPNEALAPIAPLPIWQQPEMRDYARQGLGALVVLLIALLVVRPMLKSLMSPSAPRTVDAVLEQMAERKAQLAVGGEMTGEVLGDRLSLSSAPEVPKVYEQKLVQARAAVAQDPKRVAQLVKNWIGSEG